MDWTGIRFTKVEAEVRKDAPFTDLEVALNVTRVRKIKQDLIVEFRYDTNYKPDVASIRFLGYVTITGKRDELDMVFEKWKNERTPDAETAQRLINMISYNAQVNSILVSKSLNMAAPLLSPRIQIEKLESLKPSKKQDVKKAPIKKAIRKKK